MIDRQSDFALDDTLAELRRSGIRRAILLSSPADDAAALRTRLAKTGMLVMEPPVDRRPWLGELAQRRQLEEADLKALKALLEEGIEHGVDALLVADAGLLAPVEACELAVPIIRLCASKEEEMEGRIDNVIFDMGGVLMDWSPLKIARAFAETDEDAGLLKRAVFDSREWGWQDAGAVDEDTVAWTSHLRLPERLWEAADTMAHRWHERFDPMPETGRLVHELKAAGYGVYLLSNAGESFRVYEHRIPAIDVFDGVVVSCFEHIVKPDRRLYQLICERYSLRPETCLFVDDFERNVEGARRAGMQSVVFTGDVDALRAMLL